ncbi:toll/interleukin-1 receptor domain-containing protein [Sulfurovum sp. NBC37-1]|uniref:toll/interleukin-1 receptor domain-containing protein n=1 Tax=Sulfurovum sp. (strain NBC37-1) TaxID=387093 RepID=UPI0001587B42|nr:toll/interleukin-1 receptor domain-containing protein [Sulfurovum sp. NBC37-1]BAF73054.1 hypothetical protein SUN_2114 [Sulfurovum sp. NBC37-1]
MKKLINDEHWEKKANGWVFLSHSSHDYEEVKIVRNYLEDNGFSALMFYLKSLEDEDKKNMIKPLLEWEISARNIFVSCTSSFAEESKWFKWERKYVQSLSFKIYREIDIEKLKYERCTQLSKLDNLMKQATLFFLYSHKDNYKVNKIYEQLESSGFRIFKDTASIKMGDNIQDKIYDALQETKDRGAVLIFLSKNAKESKWFWQEKQRALNQNAFIIPVLLDNTNINDFPAFRNLSYIDAKDGFSKASINELLQIINRKEQTNEME